MERHFDDVSSTRRRFSGNLVSAWGSRQRRGYHSRECRSDGCTSNTILVQTNGLCTICNGEIRKTQAKAKILMILVFRRIMFAQLASGWNTWVEGFRSLKQRQQDAQEEELEAHRLAAENAAFLRSERKRKVVAEKAAAERAADGAARLFGAPGGRVGGTPLADSMGRPLGTSLDSVAGPSASASVMQKASSHSGNAGKPHAKKPHAKKPLAKAASFKKIGETAYLATACSRLPQPPAATSSPATPATPASRQLPTTHVLPSPSRTTQVAPSRCRSSV